MGPQLIGTDFKGPLPPNTVGLLIGRSSVTMQGLVIHPGVIDSDFTGTVKIMASSPRGVFAVSPGDRIAQLLILPSCHGLFPSHNKQRENKGFGSSGGSAVYCSLELEARPLLSLEINGKIILGLLDTGADKSIISKKDWPKNWPLQVSDQMLRGLGYAQEPERSTQILRWKDEEGHVVEFQPYLLEVPISLWGRHLLTEMGYVLSNEGVYSSQSQQMMQKMGHRFGQGLGKYSQGRTSPIPVTSKEPTRKGLGFS